MPFMHVATFRNINGSTFPLDMLRYDQAFPKTEEDAFKISSIQRRVDKGQGAELIGTMITVSCVALHSNAIWTVDRWRSFGWELYDKGVNKVP